MYYRPAKYTQIQWSMHLSITFIHIIFTSYHFQEINTQGTFVIINEVSVRLIVSLSLILKALVVHNTHCMGADYHRYSKKFSAIIMQYVSIFRKHILNSNSQMTVRSVKKRPKNLWFLTLFFLRFVTRNRSLQASMCYFRISLKTTYWKFFFESILQHFYGNFGNFGKKNRQRWCATISLVIIISSFIDIEGKIVRKS